MQICDILIDREIIIVNKLDKYTTPPPPPFPILSRLEHIRDLSRDRKNIFNRDLFWRLTQALISACNNRQHSAGIQEITLRLGEYGTVGDLFPDVDELSSMEITSRLHNQFIEKFGETF